ncbi:MAG: phosphate ABC transporter permease subunit PstC [Pseudomonadota bacterium]
MRAVLRPLSIGFLALLSLAFASASGAREQIRPASGGREQIRIVGSSTVYPFSTAVAEAFSRASRFPAPIVESTGTGGGLKLFCAGVGAPFADIANASRAIKDSERRQCAGNGVAAVTEIMIGYDGIVLANAKAAPLFQLTLDQLFLALAGEVPAAGGDRLIVNPYRRWREIDPALPDLAIEVFGPPPTSGTRDAFIELAMERACARFPAYAALKARGEDAYKAACATVREDGAFIEAGENDNLIIQKLTANPRALGIFGYSFLAQNGDLLHAASIDGVAPGFDAIAAGDYPLARALYIYVKDAHLALVPALGPFIVEYTSERAAGPAGYLGARGLIPLPEEARERYHATALSLAERAPPETSANTKTAPRDALRTADAPTRWLKPSTAFLMILVLGFAGFALAQQRAAGMAEAGRQAVHSRPSYHGWYVALWTVGPAAVLILAWTLLGPSLLDGMTLSRLPADLAPGTALEERMVLDQIHRLAAGEEGFAADPRYGPAAAAYARLQASGGLIVAALSLAFAGLAGLRALLRSGAAFRARNKVESFLIMVLGASSAIAILTTLGIILSLLFESLRFFSQVPPGEFLFGLQWSPQTAIRADQVGSSGAFGAIPLFLGTLLISAIAMLVAVPIGLMAAIYMTQYSSLRFRKMAKPALEILAGIPTVVYGFFAALIVAPWVRQLGEAVGLDVASESALAAGLVMGVMIIPFMSSLADDALTAVPQAMRDGAYALGATKSETIRQVLFWAALPGIVGAFLLSVSRAIGETMIVVMAAGLAANLTINPLNSVTTVTAQIVALLTGDQEFDSAKTLSAFALGLVLFLATLMLNIIALKVVRKYRETYE